MFNSNTPFTMPVVPASYGYGSSGMGGFGGFGDSWLGLIVILALLGGWGNGGFGFGGGFGGGRGYVEPCATQADVRAAVDQQTLISKLDQQTYGLADSTYALNNAITSGFNGVQSSLCQGFNGIDRAIADCCCQTQKAILESNYLTERGFCSTNQILSKGFSDLGYADAQQTCELKGAIADSTAKILEGQRAAEMREMQDKLDALREKNSQQALFINNSQQTAQFAAMLAPLQADLAELKCNQVPVKKIACPEQYIPLNTGINATFGLVPTGCGYGYGYGGVYGGYPYPGFL